MFLFNLKSTWDLPLSEKVSNFNTFAKVIIKEEDNQTYEISSCVSEKKKLKNSELL